MALRIQRVSARELRQELNGIASTVVRNMREANLPATEDGIDDVLMERFVFADGSTKELPGVKGTLCRMRELIRDNNGDTEKIATELFDESTRERLNELQRLLEDNERKRRAGQPDAQPVTPRSGVDRGVRAVARMVWSTSYFSRNRSVDSWNDEEFGAVRFRDTITGDLPTLKVDQPQQTPRYIKFLEDLFGSDAFQTVEAEA